MSRGKRKGSLRHLSREAPSDAEQNEVLRFVTGAPAVTAAILGAALVEHELELHLIEKLKRKDPETIELLTDQGGPMGTFSAKITLAYALGVIDETDMAHLNIIRHIRNVFAHARKLVFFDHELIGRELRKIKPKGTKRNDANHALIDARKYADSDRRQSYLILCTALLLLLKMKQTRALIRGTRYYERKIAKSKALRKQLAEISPLGAMLAQLPGDQLKAAIKLLKSSQ